MQLYACNGSSRVLHQASLHVEQTADRYASRGEGGIHRATPTQVWGMGYDGINDSLLMPNRVGTIHNTENFLTLTIFSKHQPGLRISQR